ncbi:MAG TPA: hypothetical protein PK304_07330 [Mobilitalea sp.]|nr:hypothetical protein [Mobilitalea sp.]
MKHKNNDFVPQIFLTVVGVILVGIIVYYIMHSVKSTAKIADSVIAGTEKTAVDFEEYDIVKYDGEEIRGSEVINFIKKYLGDYSETEEAPIYAEVITKMSGTTYSNKYINKKHIYDIKNFSDQEHYIKPTAIFIGKVIRNENDVLIGIKFTQK